MEKTHNPDKNPSAFVAMCFDERLTHIYHKVVKPVLERHGLRCMRADEIHDTGAIVDQIKHAINEAALVICDLTFSNPNVFYELGMAHTLDKPTIMISQHQPDIPFDVRHMRILLYEDTKIGLLDLREGLGPFIQGHHGAPQKMDAPLTTFRAFRSTPDDVDEQREALLHPSLQVRRYAIKFLGDSKDERSFDTIARIAAIDENVDLVRDAFTALSKIDPERSRDILIDAGLRRQKEYLVRECVVRSLGRLPMNDDLIKQMIAQSADSSWGVRRSVYEVLGKWGSPKALKVLQKGLADPESSVRFAANEALQRLARATKRKATSGKRRDHVPAGAEKRKPVGKIEHVPMPRGRQDRSALEAEE